LGNYAPQALEAWLRQTPISGKDLSSRTKQDYFLYRPPKNQESFEVSIWEAVKKVPYGKVVTYGQVAGLVPLPDGEDEQTYRAFGARWVGAAMARCPSDIPWHRVINSQGKISLRGEVSVERQQERLEAEGVEFDERGKIDLKVFQWRPGEEGELNPRLF
jgi:methylated-DNA-protein-cysteine methyltransferase-like protein